MWNEKMNFTPPPVSNVSQLIIMRNEGQLSSTGMNEVFAHMTGHPDSPEKIALEKGLIQKSDEGELKAMIEKIIGENETVVAEYKQGYEPALQYLVGQAMKISKGSANPQVAKKLILEALK